MRSQGRTAGSLFERLGKASVGPLEHREAGGEEGTGPLHFLGAAGASDDGDESAARERGNALEKRIEPFCDDAERDSSGFAAAKEPPEDVTLILRSNGAVEDEFERATDQARRAECAYRADGENALRRRGVPLEGEDDAIEELCIPIARGEG